MPSAQTRSTTVRDSYAERSREYTDLFGTMESVHPSDRALVRSWAESLTGPVLDAGCGPGQWTDFLASTGLATRGVDLVTEFVARARREYPHLAFEVESVDDLAVADGSLGGVLAWYSLIHHEPERIRTPFAEFARVIRPGGGLLIGFFEGGRLEAFDHAVTTAYRWPVAELARELHATGFEVVETHTRTAAGARPHGAIVARRPV
ncbi:class I SAM-dependent methyltransferase [Rhodococcus triatomae]|nr:methyltransferase [Rhodococcus triatomae BKS 15-14]